MRAAAVLDAPSQPYENLFIRPGLENYSLATLPQTTTPGGFGAYAGTTPNAYTTQVVASSWAQSGRAFRATWTTRSVANGDIGLSINSTGNGIAATRWPDIVGQKVTAVWDVLLSDDNAWNGITITGVTGGTVTVNAAVAGVVTIRAGVPTRVWVTFTIGAGVTNITSIRVNLQNLPLTAGVWAEISNAQLYLGDYVPGKALGTGTLAGWLWSGTAGSSSSRGYPYPQPMTGPQLRPGSQNGSITGLSTTITLPTTWTASDFLLLFVNSNYTQTLTFPTRVDAFTQLATSGPPIAGGTGGSGPTVVASATNYTNSGTTCTTTITGLTGGELLHASVMHRSTLTIPSGWTLLQQAAPPAGESSASGVQQWQSVLYKTNPAGTTSASIAPVQASTGRMNVALVAISGAGTPIARPELAVTFGSTVGGTATLMTSTKDSADLFLWSADSVYWSSAVSPNGVDWTYTPSGMGYYGAGEKDSTAWQPRLGVFTDALPAGARSFQASDTTVSTSNTSGEWIHLLATQIPSAGASTPGDPNAGLLQAFRITPTPGSASIVVNATTNGILRWWCGAYTQASLTAAVAAAANNLGNNTTAAIEVPSVTLPKVALGNELYVSVAGVNSSATWGTPADLVFASPSGNGVISIRSGLIPAGANSYVSTPFDRGLEGTSRNESAMTLVLQAA